MVRSGGGGGAAARAQGNILKVKFFFVQKLFSAIDSNERNFNKYDILT